MIAVRSKRSGAAAAALALAGLLACAGGGVSTPAAAQAFYGVEEVDAVLAPRAVLGRLSRDGYRAFSHPRFDGEAYTVDADSPWGNRVRLIVDARSGRLIDRERIEAPLYPPGAIPGGRRAGYGWTEADVRVPPAESSRDPALRAPYRGELTYGREEPMEERRVATRPGPLPSDRPAVSRAAPGVPPAAAAAPAAPGVNPLGLNPDSPEARAVRRPETPRRIAKPAKPVESPAALIEPKPAAKAAPAPEAKPAETVADASPPPAPKAAEPGWKSPPDGGRPVRVIGGVTPVPAKDEAKNEAK